VLKPDAGEMRWRGRPVAIGTPAQARRLGIGMVFQHFSLFEALTVAENITLGLDDKESRRDLRSRIAEISSRYGLPLDPDRVVHDLSVGERQRIEIVRCLLQNPALLIMDEPTSVLTPPEIERLFQTLRRLAAEGCTILYISHKLEEIGALCDEATILRHGRVVATCDPRRETKQRLAELMIGADLNLHGHRRSSTGSAGAPRLIVDRLSLSSTRQFGTALRDISFTVTAGEILGIGGVAGNGQTELMEALSGEVLSDQAGAVCFDDTPVGRLGIAERRRMGGCFAPEERRGHAAVPGLTLSENAFLSAAARKNLVQHGFIDLSRTAAFTAEVIRRFDVRTPGPTTQARALSGGNLQKFIIGREVLQQPRVLIINQPTWGVDVGAALAIQRAIVELADAGTAVVVISQDLDEIMTLCDRVAIIAGGRLSAPVRPDQTTLGEIGLLMGGIRAVASDAA